MRVMTEHHKDHAVKNRTPAIHENFPSKTFHTPMEHRPVKQNWRIHAQSHTNQTDHKPDYSMNTEDDYS